MTARIYLDNAATTAVRPEVADAMQHFVSECPYNPSSVHAEGRAARAALDQARERVARCLGARPKEIVFTASGSESDNLALAGVSAAAPQSARFVSTVTEHHAVLHALEALRSTGCTVELLPVDQQGRLDAQAFEAALVPETRLASVAYANNELGTIQPISQLAAAARARGVLMHTDAVQAAAYLPIDVEELGVDLLTLAAHKFYGPKGAGVLYVREGTPIAPIVHGGPQEHALRAGTENLAAIVGLACALELALDERTKASARVATLRDKLERAVTERIPGARVNGAQAHRTPHISNMSFLGVESEQLLLRLDLDGIAVSAGSACASGAVEPSHVVAALGLAPECTRGVVRFSLGRATSETEIDCTVKVLEQAVSDLRSVSEAPLAFK